MNIGNLITGINSINYFRISTPALESHFHALYCVMGRYCCAVQCIFCILIYLCVFWCAFASICVIGQCNSFFHRFIFSNVNSQIRIRNPANLICTFGNCYSVVATFFDRNFNFTAGVKSVIFCQYDFGNVICSYTSAISGVPEIINGFISTQTISICKIFLAVKTNLFRKISF